MVKVKSRACAHTRIQMHVTRQPGLGRRMELLRKLTPAPDSARTAVGALLRSIGRAGRHTYPFGNPVSIERTHVPVVKQLPYWVAEKTDGMRMALICTRSPDTTQAVSYVMDRVGRLYGIPVLAPRQIFDGSLFDAELVFEPAVHGYKLYIFDVAMLRGSADIAKRPTSDRLAAIHAIFSKADVVPTLTANDDDNRAAALLSGKMLCARPDVALVAKPMFRTSDAQALAASVATLAHATDGYILTPEGEGASDPGVAWTTFKIKTCHTIDLLWSAGMLWYGEGETLFPISDLRLDGLAATPSFHAVEYSGIEGCIVEASPIASSSAAGTTLTLAFVKTRPDREAPNNAVCVSRTLKSALDAVVLEDVMMPPTDGGARGVT